MITVAPPGANQIAGTPITYTLAGGSATAAPGTPIVLTFTLGAGQVFSAQAVCPPAPGTTTLFTIGGAPGSSSVTCVYDGVGAGVMAPIAATFSVTVQTQPNGASQAGAVATTESLTITDTGAPVAVAGPVTGIMVPNLSMTKVCPSPVNAGGASSCTITVSNAAGATNATATGTVWSDTFPAEMTPGGAAGCVTGGQLVTCTLGPIAPGGSIVVVVPYTVKTNVPNGTTVTNTATVTASDQINNPGAVTASAPIVINSIAHLVFSITPTKSSVTSTPPEAFSWIYQITNDGTSPLINLHLLDDNGIAENAVLIVDPAVQAGLPGGCSVATIMAAPLGCQVPPVIPPLPIVPAVPPFSLDAGATLAILVSMKTVTTVPPVPAVVLNSAKVWADGNGLAQGAFASAAAPVTATGNININNSPILTITKSFSGATVGFATSGALYSPTMTVTVTNVGLGTANVVSMTDPAPAGLTFGIAGGAGCATNGAGTLLTGTAATLAPGANITCTVTVNLTAATTPANGSGFVNTASVTSTEQVTPLTASATVSAAVPVLTVTKDTTSATVTSAAGVTFIIVVTNTGSAKATGVTVDDWVPPTLVVDTANITGGPDTGSGLTCLASVGNHVVCGAGDLDPGEFHRVNVPVTLAAGTLNGTLINNVAWGDSAETAAVSGSVQVMAAAPSLSVTKTPSKDPVSSNPVAEVFAFNVTVTNNGPIATTGLTITDTLPTGIVFAGASPFTSGGFTCTVAVGVTCTGANLSQGQSANIAIPVKVSPAVADGTNFTNTAVANCTNCPVSAQGVTNVTVQNNPLLSMTKVVTTGDPAVAGSLITYQISVINNGGTTATVLITDATPVALTSVSATDNSGTIGPCTVGVGGPNLVSCAGTIVATPGNPGAVTITISGTIPIGTPDRTVLANYATLTSAGQPTIHAQVVTNVISATLTVTKTNSPLLLGPSGVVTSSVVVTNNGSTTASRVSVFDDLPAGATFIALGSTPSCFPVGTQLALLNGAINSSVTTITVDTPSTASFVKGQTIQVDSEKMTVVTVPNATTLTVTRGTEGTTAAAHLDNAPVLSANNAAGTQDVTCIGGDLTAGSSTTFIIKWNAGSTPGISCNTALTANNNGFPNASAQACVTVVSGALGGFLRHVDVDNATEDVAGDTPRDFDADPTEDYPLASIIQDDPDDATGSLHTACLISPTFGLNEQGDITWQIVATAGSAATVFPPPSGVKVMLDIDGEGADNDDDAANCVQWRSSGVGGQTITATYGVTGQVIYWNGVSPLIKQWNDIDSTKIVQAEVNVGETLLLNSGAAGGPPDLNDWVTRECRDISGNDVATAGACAGTDFNGTTVEVSGGEFNTGLIWASGKSFIDYTFGNHADYNGPVDGAQQTYTVTGTCGSVRLENPVTGTRIILDNDPSATFPASATVLSSDKGVGFQAVPTNDGSTTTTLANADCRHDQGLTVTITTREEVQIRSDLDTAAVETVKVNWVHGPGDNKQPQLAWAGMRVVLEWDWRQPDGTCNWTVGSAPFYVRYAIQHPSPGFLSTVPGEVPAVVTGPDFIIVQVDATNSLPRANDDCISRVIYESQEPGEVDVTAHVVAISGSAVTVLSPEYDFLVYYMKLEDITLTTDEADNTANVSDNIDLKVMVRGWTVLPSGGNCPTRAQGQDSHGGVLPANRCIFPDDWDFLGGPNPELTNPNLDIWSGLPSGCPSTAAGPFSLLDKPNCAGTSRAPKAEGGFRDAVFTNGDVNDLDAPMPPAEVFFAIDLDNDNTNNSGFLSRADSTKVPWDRANIPAEPWITTALSGYLWDSFGGGGFEIRCADGVDDDSDTLVNDGCPAVGAAEATANWCGAAVNNDPLNDGLTNDGCPAVGAAEATALWCGAPNAVNNDPLDDALINDGCPQVGTVAETACADALDDDGDGTFNDGCPQAGAQSEDQCANTADDDADGAFNDGCPVAPAINGQSEDQCANTTDDDAPIDGFVNDGCPAVGTPETEVPAAGSGLYDFWEIARHDARVVSCARNSEDAIDDGNPATDPCPNEAGQGVLAVDAQGDPGYKRVTVYSDNHGEAHATITGDADLDFQGCFSAADNASAPHNIDGVGDIKQITGFYCETDDVVGKSQVNVIVNYPDKQGKHYPLAGAFDEITWTWGGIKQIEVTATAGDQFSFVILHVTGRDGTCASSLHPVLGESVDWLIDSGDGTIVDGEILVSIAAGGRSAVTKTFDPDTAGTRERGTRVDTDECQTWIQVVSTLLHEVNVLITAHDPEGDIIFDTKLNLDSDHDGVRDVVDNCPDTFNPDQKDDNGFEDGEGEGDACEVIPTPAPEPTGLWGDVDCDKDVDSADAMKVLQTVVGLPINQTGPCHAMGDSITVDGDAQMFGDWDCDGNVTSVDALAILRWIVSDPLALGNGCPIVGELVDIS